MAINGLSRQRHGFEPRWDYHKKTTIQNRIPHRVDRMTKTSLGLGHGFLKLATVPGPSDSFKSIELAHKSLNSYGK